MTLLALVLGVLSRRSQGQSKIKMGSLSRDSFPFDIEYGWTTAIASRCSFHNGASAGFVCDHFRIAILKKQRPTSCTIIPDVGQ